MGQLKRALKTDPAVFWRKMAGYDEIFTIALRKRKGNKTILEDASSPFTCIGYSDRFWYADPLIFEKDGRSFLFAEAYDRDTNRGLIAAAELGDNPEDYDPKTVISEDYHMSFPYVFSWGDQIFMIPETGDNWTVNLYRAEDFPYKWEKVREFRTKSRVVDVIAEDISDDSVILQGSYLSEENGLYTGFVKLKLKRSGDAYNLFIDDDKVDYNLRDRNAGGLFCTGDRIFHPTQESTETDYGVYINISDEEGRSVRIAPEDVNIRGIGNARRIGVHTYSLSDTVEAIDVRYLRFSAKTWPRRVRKLWKKSRES